jgi:hypothetical protein
MNIVEQYVKLSIAKMETYVQMKLSAPTFKLKTTISFGDRRCRSWGGIRGGRPFVSLAVKRFEIARVAGTAIDFLEYSNIKSDPVIGSLAGVSWTKAVDALVAHEIAHAVQYYPGTKKNAMAAFGFNDSQSRSLKNHNIFWQKIYADLRTKFVNGADSFPALSEYASRLTAQDNRSDPPQNDVKPKRPHRVVSKGWTATSHYAKTVRTTIYHDAAGNLLGILCVRKAVFYRYYPEEQKYVKLTAKNQIEARRSEFGI